MSQPQRFLESSMLEIPDRGNLKCMSRSDIQKLCKDNNVKANMRTDQMIDALCDLVNGKEVPRPHRSISERVPPQPMRISRRTIIDLQTHVGKGGPVGASGTGARKSTKVASQGRSAKTKASAMLQEPLTTEQDGFASTVATLVKEDLCSSLLPISPRLGHSHLPTSVPSLPPAQFNALEARVQDLESRNLSTRVEQLEQTWTNFPSVTVKELHNIVVGIAESHAHIEAKMTELIIENKVLKAKVSELETLLQDRVKGPGGPLGTPIVYPSPQNSEPKLENSESDKNATSTIPPVLPCGAIATTPKTRRRLNDELPDPSPSRPTLGKRARCDSPDTSMDGALTPVDPDRDAIERITRPLRKRQRLDNDENPMLFIPMGCRATAPITSTPKHTPMQLHSRPKESIVADMPKEQALNQAISTRDPKFFLGGPVFNSGVPVFNPDGPITELPFPIQIRKTPGTSDPVSNTVSSQQRPREASSSEKFHPYLTSGRSPSSGSSRRTGLTPRRLSMSLKSPALPTVPELSETGESEESPTALHQEDTGLETLAARWEKALGKYGWPSV